MTAFRIGIVGAGFGATSHLPALRNHPRFEVVAIASPRSAPEIARRANVPHCVSLVRRDARRVRARRGHGGVAAIRALR